MVRAITLGMILMLAACAKPVPGSLSLPPDVSLPSWTPSIQLADTALASGAPAMALQVSDQLLARNPRDVQALIRRGNAQNALNRPAEAAANYNAALELQPKDVNALMGLGRIRLQQDPAAAEALFAQAVVLDARNVAALSNMGVARDLQGHHATAQEAYRRALGVTPSSVALQVNLGLSLALSGDTAGAIQLLKPVATAPSATPKIRHDFALALSLDGQRREAWTLLGGDMTPEELRGTLDGFEALRR